MSGSEPLHGEDVEGQQHHVSRRRSGSASQADGIISHLTKKKQKRGSRQQCSQAMLIKPDAKNGKKKEKVEEVDDVMAKILNENGKGGSVLERRIRALWGDVSR